MNKSTLSIGCGSRASPNSRLLRLSCIRAGALFLSCLAAGAARADVVTTKDGIVLEGRVTPQEDGGLILSTDEGDVKLAATAVASVKAGDGPRTLLKRESSALKADDVEGHFRLALRSEEQGASDLARAEYETILKAVPDHAAARRALQFEKVGSEWMPADEARRRRGLVLYEGKWLLPAEADAAARAAPAAAPSAGNVAKVGGKLTSVMRSAAIGESALKRAATLALASVPVTDRVAAALTLLNDGDPKVRIFACDQLAALGDESGLRPLILSGVRDADPDVRRAAVLAATAFGHDDLAIPFAKALFSMHPGLVANAARALAMLGDTRAVGYVIKRISAHGGSARSVMQVLTQVSYVRDYDVEIAQASNIANPQIGYVKEGVVLDMKVIDAGVDKTVVETVLLDSFNSLTGSSFRTDDEVLAWYGVHGKELPDFPDAPGARRPKAAMGRGAMSR